MRSSKNTSFDPISLLAVPSLPLDLRRPRSAHTPLSSSQFHQHSIPSIISLSNIIIEHTKINTDTLKLLDRKIAAPSVSFPSIRLLATTVSSAQHATPVLTDNTHHLGLSAINRQRSTAAAVAWNCPVFSPAPYRQTHKINFTTLLLLARIRTQPGTQ